MTDACATSINDPPASRASGVATALRTRSAVTNGTRAFLEPVGDTAESRRLRDLQESFAVRFDARDEDKLTRCRGAARLAFQLEQLDARAARGESVDAALVARLTGRCERILARLEASARPSKRGVR